MRINYSTQRVLLFLVTLLLFNSLVEGSVRHGRKRLFSGRSTNRTFEVKDVAIPNRGEIETSYRKSKRNFLDSFEASSGLHPFCNYPKVMDIVSKSNYYVEFYKKMCNPYPQSGHQTRSPSEPRPRSARNSRRGHKKNELSPKKKKKIDKLLKKSMCRTLKTMVPVEGPFPDEKYYPCKVLVKRCSGCCVSRLVECVPTKTKTRRFDVLRSSHLTNQSVYKAKVEEHVKCECKCKVKASDCGPGQIYEENNCLCKCPVGSHTTCPQTKRWSERECKCICKKKKDCSTGMRFNNETCMCEHEQSYSEVSLYEELS